VADTTGPGGADRHAQAGSNTATANSGINWLEVAKVVTIPLVTLILGFAFNSAVTTHQTEEHRIRLYTEMMGRREESDSALRKDMFNSILGTFMSKDPKLTRSEQLDQEVLSLELMAYNFHESLDLGPLFKHVARRISRENLQQPGGAGPMYPGMLKRLDDVTLAVVERQLTLLSDTGVVVRGDVALIQDSRPAETSEPEADPVSLGRESLDATVIFPHAVSDPETEATNTRGISRVCLSLNSPGEGPHHRQFGLEVTAYDRISHEVHVLLYVSRLLNQDTCLRGNAISAEDLEIQGEFWVGSFDLPMIDNTHLTHGERCAVSLTRLSAESAQVTISYFPASRASLKEKPYYDDLIHDLIEGEKLRRSDPH
jgi:hypothetical protein